MYSPESPYRLDFQREHCSRRPSDSHTPSSTNGLGLSIALQGDRFVVAAFFDLPRGDVFGRDAGGGCPDEPGGPRIVQTTIWPVSIMRARILPRMSQEVERRRVLVADLGALYAGAVVLLLNPVVMFVFERKFHSRLFGNDPLRRHLADEARPKRSLFTSVMLNAGRTKRLAGLEHPDVELARLHGPDFVLQSFDDRIAGQPAGRVSSRVWSSHSGWPGKGPRWGASVSRSRTVVAVLFFTVRMR